MQLCACVCVCACTHENQVAEKCVSVVWDVGEGLLGVASHLITTPPNKHLLLTVHTHTDTHTLYTNTHTKGCIKVIKCGFRCVCVGGCVSERQSFLGEVT